jgi:hypothetical protein
LIDAPEGDDTFSFTSRSNELPIASIAWPSKARDLHRVKTRYYLVK